ncbi:acetoacetate decarboxylase family protein [Sphingobium sp. R-7]|uniref:acetoacetate decarboxylase family protein n=1 Tax=Sphingobium sp. R-7 TaxID=3375449 RepID=UPI00398ABAB3
MSKQNVNASSYTGGILNMIGARPGMGFQYDGPTMIDTIWYSITLTTTHDAIEKLIIPPPLKVDRDLPPDVRILYFVNRNTRGYDGELTPYQGFMFMANTVHQGRKGSAGWEYVDAVRGDKTDMDIMGSWSVYFGMLKKMANISFLPVSANEFEVTVERRGVRLVTMRFRVGEEMPAESVQAINDSMVDGTFTVREIPNADFSGFADRTICWTPTSENKMQRAWHLDGGAVEFGNLPLDPLDEMPVLGVAGGISFQASTGKRIFTAMEVVEQLPLTADFQEAIAAE